jgi:predicted transcriptional regulator
MSVNLAVSESLAEHLWKMATQEHGDIDRVLQTLLETEYRRRLMRYRLIDQQMRQKYGMDFAAFEDQQVVKQQGFTWAVEADAIAWETAVDGVATIQHQLDQLSHDPS